MLNGLFGSRLRNKAEPLQLSVIWLWLTVIELPTDVARSNRASLRLSRQR
jgi:hypothetical protein